MDLCGRFRNLEGNVHQSSHDFAKSEVKALKRRNLGSLDKFGNSQR